jgi:hypothetical protein
MKSQIWRERRVLLIILGILLAANTIFFFTYRVQYEQRLRALDERLAKSESELASARGARIAAEQQVASYAKIQKDVEEIYNSRWATREERLTRLITEVKRLTVASNLVPKTINFTQAEAGQRGSSTRAQGLNATEVGMAFAVEGSYQQVRRLINLLELSEQFVIVQEIGLTSDTNSESGLNVNLLVKTLFREATPARRRAGSRTL